MRVKFQADADLDVRIVRGVKRRQPHMDFQDAEQAGLRGLEDLEVLCLAADSDRILVTHDRRTMPRHYRDFIANRTSPGVIIVPKDIPIRTAVEELMLIWVASQAEEWHNRLLWLPL